jgi:hypothetical protein
MTGQRVPLPRRRALALGAVLAGSLIAGVALAQGPYNERDVRREMNVEDKSEDVLARESKIWVLDFRFKDPRLITVDIPGRGRKICMYLWYQVINNTKEPHNFIPDFELVTYDKPGVFHDQVLPKVQEAVRQVEDPTGYLNIKNSVTIAAEPIPLSKADANPKAVTGVAIWDDINPDANRYSIFVSGLSNGWSLAEIPPDNKQVVRRKTLQLNFKRLGDRYYQHSGEIRFVPPSEWIYRAAAVVPPSGMLKEKEKEKAAPPKKDEKGAALPPLVPGQTTSSKR